MARQKGIIKLDGTVGGVTFYQSEGQSLARLSNGPSKEQIENDPNFIRTRENNVEFGGSAIVAKSFRLSMISIIQSMSDSRIISRLTALFKEINKKGTGARGQRAITLSANAPILNGLEFNRFISFGSVFQAPFTFSNNAARDEGTVVIPAFLPANYIKAPSGATHFRIVHSVGAVSDYIYDPSTNTYIPIKPDANGIGSVSTSAFTALNATVAVNFTLTTQLPGPPTMTGDTSGVQALGIEFYQFINGNYYLLAQDNAMKVIDVF